MCIHHTFRHHVTVKAHHDIFVKPLIVDLNTSSLHTTQRCIVEVGPPILRVAISQEPPFIIVTGFLQREMTG